MTDSARYAKIVDWSEENQCFVGSSPGLIYGGCHGQDEREVFDQLCRIVDEAVALYKEDGRPLPPATAGLFGQHGTSCEQSAASACDFFDSTRLQG